MTDGRCRLCKANDLDALIEELAAELWESRRHGTLDDRPWEEAGPYWKPVYRELAQTAVTALGARHEMHGNQEQDSWNEHG